MSAEDETKTPPAEATQAPAGGARAAGKSSRPRRSGLAVAVPALLLSLLALAGLAAAGYYVHLQLQGLEQRTDNLASAEALESLRQRLDSRAAKLADRLDNLAGRTSSQTENLAQLRQELQRLQQDQHGLAQRMDHFAELAESRRYEWARSEAAYLASVAVTRLRLMRDVDSALQALKQADSLLAGFGGRTVDARQGIRKVIEALLQVQKPDIAALSDRLMGLSASVPDLPLRGQPGLGPSDGEQADQQPAPTPAEGWSGALQRAWARFRASLSELVVIDRAADQPPLIGPEQRFYLTQNLQLQLEAARAALVRREASLYRDSLRQAQRWLTRYYDTDRAVVRTARDELQALMDARLQADLPRIRPMLQSLLGNDTGEDDA